MRSFLGAFAVALALFAACVALTRLGLWWDERHHKQHPAIGLHVDPQGTLICCAPLGPEQECTAP